MRYKYAQIDMATGVCFSISNLSGEIEAKHMIPLDPDEDVQLGDIYVDGEWNRPEPTPEPGPEPDLRTELEQFKVANADLQAANSDLLLRLGDVELIMAEILTGGGE
ncbi:hypothetical protein [Paenibacillus sp. y28]|uniref:hypothetical protein n=1 Tax=Paenibacillus sp. y28 TaxID=3129110 RepID=UPI00301B2263